MLVDIGMQKQSNGLSLARQVVARHPTIRILMLTMQHGQEFVREAKAAAASGYVLENDAGCAPLRRDPRRDFGRSVFPRAGRSRRYGAPDEHALRWGSSRAAEAGYVTLTQRFCALSVREISPTSEAA